MRKRLWGYVVSKRVRDWKTRDWHRDEEGEAKLFPFVRRAVEGEPIRDFRLFPHEFQTPGLELLRDGQIIEFEPDGDRACDFVRVPSEESRRWRDTVEAIRSQNGQSGFNLARVTYYNSDGGYGFAALEANPESEVHFRAKNMIRRDRDDFVGFRFPYDRGQEIYVRIAGPPRAGQSASPTAEVICFEEDE